MDTGGWKHASPQDRVMAEESNGFPPTYVGEFAMLLMADGIAR